MIQPATDDPDTDVGPDEDRPVPIDGDDAYDDAYDDDVPWKHTVVHLPDEDVR